MIITVHQNHGLELNNSDLHLPARVRPPSWCGFLTTTQHHHNDRAESCIRHAHRLLIYLGVFHILLVSHDLRFIRRYIRAVYEHSRTACCTAMSLEQEVFAKVLYVGSNHQLFHSGRPRRSGTKDQDYIYTRVYSLQRARCCLHVRPASKATRRKSSIFILPTLRSMALLVLAE